MENNTFENQLKTVEPIIYKLSCTDIPGMDREDIQQELRIEAWCVWKTYDANNGAKFATYAYPMLKRRTIDLHRRSSCKKRMPTEKILSLESLFDDKSYEPSRTVEENESSEMTELIKNACSDLPELDQNIAWLLMSGYNHNEIAKMCHVSHVTVSRHKAIIKNHLLQAMARNV